MPQNTPPLTPKEQYEKEFNVKIPDLVPDDPTDPAIDKDEPLAATFDGDNPEIPYVLIMLVAVFLMVVAGLVIFREKIIVLVKGKQRTPLKPVLENDIYE